MGEHALGESIVGWRAAAARILPKRPAFLLADPEPQRRLEQHQLVSPRPEAG